MQMNHFSHDHVLILTKDQMEDGQPVICYACMQPIYGLSYSCGDCLYFLHKLCAQLPQKLSHPSHLEHTLSLRPTPPSYYDGSALCDLCGEECNRFVYHCESCGFYVDIKCASMAANIKRRIKHKCHEQHELMPIEKPASFVCDGCGTKHKEDTTSYICTTCGFWVSQECANSLPCSFQLHSTISSDDDVDYNHSCNLLYSFPCEIWGSEIPSCKLCQDQLNRGRWNYGYFEEGFEYVFHVNCALPMIEHSRDGIIEVDLQDLRLQLKDISHNSMETTSSGENAEGGLQWPRADDTVDIFTKFLEHVSLTQGKYIRWNGVMKDGKHLHPLKMFWRMEGNAVCEVCEEPLSADGETKYRCSKAWCSFFLHERCALLPDELEHPSHPEHMLSLTRIRQTSTVAFCGGCGLGISGTAPVYLCTRARCNFFLHEWCAFLPGELQHPSHPEHSLCLTTRKSGSGLSYYRCQSCHLVANIFVYACLECEFYLDIKCACLPRTIRHEAHKHSLALRITGRYASCHACGDHRKIQYVCDICKFSFCTWCAGLPRIARHRYDKHPFVLTYDPIDRDFPDEGFCELCVEEIKPGEWFYHCAECDQSLHTKCRFPVDLSSNVTSAFRIHPYLHEHSLYLHQTAEKPFSCGVCGKLVLRHSNKALHCKLCEYWLHADCYVNGQVTHDIMTCDYCVKKPKKLYLED